MIISGFTTRSLANENAISFDIDATFSNVTGRCEIGFTGLSGLNSHFTFWSGRVYDIDNRYVWSYQQLNSINISGNIVSGNYNYFINDVPVCFLGNKPDGYYSGFYINPVNVTVDVSINVFGDAPEYSLSYPINVLTGQSITGYIINEQTINNQAFKIFSGSIFAQDVLFSLNYLTTGVQISGNSSGQFVIDQVLASGVEWQTTLGSYNIPMSLFTNFGQQTTGLNINIIASPLYNIQIISMFSGASGFGLNAGYAYVDQILTQSTTGQSFCFSLTSISGFDQTLTGYFDLSGNYSGNVSGFIQGTDYVYGNVNNLSLSPSGDYYGNIVSGVVSTPISQLVDPTGLIIYHYGLAVSGFATGLAPLGTQILATGYATGRVSGYIIQSGTLQGFYFAPLVSGQYFGYLNTGGGQVLVTGFQWTTGNFFFSFSGISFYGQVTGDGISGFFDSIYKLNTGENVIINNGSGTFAFSDIKSGNNFSGELRRSNTPIMTSNSTPAGFVTANNQSFGQAYLAFDNNIFTTWGPNGSVGFIQYNFGGVPTGICNAYSITSSYGYPLYPSTWAISGSNDGITWSNLDSKTGITFTGAYSSQYFELNNSSLYNILRLSIFASKSGEFSDPFSLLEIAEINFIQRNLVYSSGSSYLSANFDGVNFTGYGNYTGTFSGQFTGYLTGNISGYVPSVTFKTGTLSENVNPGSGSFTWTNISLSDSPTGVVYNLPPYKTIQATGEIWFLNSTGSGLNAGDTINIQTNQFYFGNGNNVPFEFNSPQNLVNIVNSGATGVYGASFQQTISVTGRLNSNVVQLSSLLLGESGNQLKLTRAAQNLNSIYIPYRYFQSGVNIYNTSNSYTGIFTGQYDTLTVENSGIYYTSGISGSFYNVNATTGIIWVDSFSGNWKVISGNLEDIYQPISYLTGISGFSGCTVIPSATGQNFSGINLTFQKQNPYNISGDYAQYIIKIDGNYYSGVVQG